MEEPGAVAALRSLKRLISGGEALPDPLTRQLQDSSLQLLNTYGPTETTICVVAEKVEAHRPVRLGQPLARSQAYVLDEAGLPTPIGVPGELFLGGEGLARGYRALPHLTAERFVPDAFSSTPGARLYRTGDRVRWNPDGTLSYLGRTDFQLKVRGVRVEPEEVEAALCRLPGVRQAAVLPLSSPHSSDVRLVAFLVLDDATPFLPSSLRHQLSRLLPEALLPSPLVSLPSLPTTTNGKVDRRALSSLPLPASSSDAPFQSPSGPLEVALAQLFCQVLGLSSLSRNDDFFSLGGHSLSATRLVARIRSSLGVDLPLSSFFSAPSVASLAREVEGLSGTGTSLLPAPTPRAEASAPVLSSTQERLWFIQQLQPDSSAYHIPEAALLQGALDVDALESALRWLVSRHAVLRLAVPSDEGRPAPFLRDVPERVLTVQTLSDAPLVLEERLRLEAERVFPMAEGPLYRFHLWRLSPERHALLLVFHHLLVDELALSVLVRELGVAYRAFQQAAAPELPPVTLDWADVAAWQRTEAVLAHEDAHLAYWTRQLADAPRLLSLPTDKPRPAVLSSQGRVTAQRPLAPEVSAALHDFCRLQGVTPFMVLYAAFAALLHRYSDQPEVCVGTPMAGRTHPATEDVVGLFVNTVVLRTHAQPEDSFASLLARVRTTVLESIAHQDAPFERVVQALDVQRSPRHSPLFQVMFGLIRAGHALAEALPGLHGRPLWPELATSQFDLSVVMTESPEGFSLAASYSTDLFEAETVERLQSHYSRLLEHALQSPSSRLDTLPMASDSERGQLLRAWNDTQRMFAWEGALHERFEAWALRTPDALAVVDGRQALTYDALNRRANQVAWALRARGVAPEVRVALILERGVDLATGVLGILKAGGAYVPVDAAYPRERIARVLQDSGVQLALTQSSLLASVEPFGIPTLCVDAVADMPAQGDANPPRVTAPEHLAYVIYTSGSTGQPKGIMVQHGSMMNLRAALAESAYAGTTGPLRVSLNASISFDASVQQLVQLADGHTLCVVPQPVRDDVSKLCAWLVEQRVDVFDCVPSHLRLLLDEGLGGRHPLRVLVGGEAVDEVLWERLVRHPGLTCFNVYGPTECTVDVTAHPIDAGRPSIGRPFANVCMYVLDAHLEPVPLGLPGELYIAGASLARGYLGQPALTAERFIPNPFGTTPGERLYRTGDQVRWRAHGTLEYLGRVDTQVKVRGFRIELAEVETALLAAPGVRAAVALVREDAPGDSRLVAYVVPQSVRASTLELASLRAHLKQLLPEHMVPSAILAVDALPTTTSGKVDRGALAALPSHAVESAPRGEPPRGPVEELLAQVFCQVLGVTSVARDDDFFSLGGHSLSATRLMARVRQSFGAALPLTALFASPSVAGLARELARVQGTAGLVLPAPERREDGERAVLSSAQERMWLLHRLQPESSAYHLPEALELTGPLDVAALEASLQWLVSRHAVLRLVVPASSDGNPAPRLIAVPERVLEVETLELAPEALEQCLQQEAERPFSMEDGPLYRFHLWRLSSEHHVLLLVFHHLLVDGHSLSLLLNELAEAYPSFQQGGSPAAPRVALDNADVATWQRTEPLRAHEDAHLTYWMRELADAPPLLQLPTDTPRPAALTGKGGLVSGLRLSAELDGTLRAFCREHGVTPFMALQAAFAGLLHRYSGQLDVCVGVPVSGRTHPATEDVVGLFVNTVVLRTRFLSDDSFSSLLSRTRTTSLDAFSHQDAPFERVVHALGIQRSANHAPLVQVAFVWNRAGAPLHLGASASRPLSVPSSSAKLDLALLVREDSQGFELATEYSSDLYEAGSVERMLGHYLRLLESALAAPQAPLASHSLLSAEERQRVLHDFNATERPFDSLATFVSLWDAQVARTPAATALLVADSDDSLTYQQLDARASALAGHLSALGAGPESVVAVCVERSASLLVSLLAVLKAGAAYLPLEPSHPEARRASLIQQAGARLVVASHCLFSQPLTGVRLVSPDAFGLDSAPLRPASPHHLALVLFTSGTTGQPKAVEVSHRSLSHLFDAADALYPSLPGDCTLAAASVAFDVHVLELLYPLTRGARVVLRPTGPDSLSRHASRYRATHLLATPSVLLAALEEAGAEAAFLNLSFLQLGGEPPPPSLLLRLSQGPVRLLNGYGPCEATCLSSLHLLSPGAPPLLGRPLPRVRAYVLDDAGLPVPIGVPGELFLGGAGLARGYRALPHLTAERFVPDAFSSTPGARLYRTGDRVRWNPDGTLSYLGRTDFQVKVRGVRVEPEEVEAALSLLPGVRQAAVLPLSSPHSSDVRLVAFVSLLPGFSSDSLLPSLALSLPAPLVPSRLLSLDSLPTSPNGKVDRRALASLPLPSDDSPPSLPPQGHVEELLAQLFCQVLGLSSLSRHDDFFSLGGHSLSATRLAARIRSSFGVELPLSSLFSSPSVAALARELEGIQGATETSLPAPTPRHDDERARLSYSQERMWFLHQLQPDSSAYHMPEALELTGPLDIEALEAALHWMVSRHTVLRLAVPASRDGHPVPLLQPAAPRVLSVEHLEPDASATTLTAHLRHEADRPFSMAEGPLYRFRLWQLTPQRHVLLLVFHHLLVDGTSLSVLMREMAEAYLAFTQDSLPSLAPVDLSWADVAVWQRMPRLQEREERQREYWVRQLADAPRLLQLPTDKPRPSVLTGRGGSIEGQQLSPALTQALRAFCREHGVTPFMALQAAFAGLLHRYSGQLDVCVGVPVSGRTHPATEDVVGLFVNTVVLRTRFLSDDSFSSLLSRTRTTSLNAFSHQDAPFERVVHALGIQRSPNHAPLVQVAFVWNRAGAPLHLGALSSRSVPVSPSSAKLDLSLHVFEDGDSLHVGAEYSSDLYEAGSVERMLGHYLRLLESALAAPQAPLASHSLLSAEERQRVLHDFNATERPFDSLATFVSLWDAQVARTPAATALLVADSDDSLTYQQLDARASALAGHLSALGAGPESVVAVCVERSASLLVSLLAVLKAGAAYLPLEPSHPEARRASLIQQAGARLVVASHCLFSQPLTGVRLVSPDAFGLDSAPLRPASPHHLALVLFTSGTTGQPKAVEVSHRSLSHLFDAADALYPSLPGDCTLAAASVAFDVHVLELLYPLTRGARVVLRPTGPDSLSRHASRYRATHLLATPSVLLAALEEAGAEAAFLNLSFLQLGGEPPPPSLLLRLSQGPVRLLNGYGPCEATCLSSLHLLSPGAPPLLGRPLPRVRAYVLDDAGLPVPIGVPGELFLGGAGLARGYRALPHLTAERFVPDAFSSTPGARLYRTGDRVRWNPDGTLSYLGRTDFQVKVRGVRVEPEEVEAALSLLPGVRQAAVLPLSSPHSSDVRLVAFVSLLPGFSSDSLLPSLALSLPAPLVPSRLLSLDSLPTSPNGKVDRRALASLPLPSDDSPPSLPPQGHVEELLAQLFCQVLGLSSLSRHDDFFSLGGHSLSATRLAARIRSSFGVELPLSSLFSSPSVAALAQVIGTAAQAQDVLRPASPRPSRIPASLVQERLWYALQLPDAPPYVVQVSLVLEGALDAAKLEAALETVLEHNETLRTTFHLEADRVIARVHGPQRPVLSRTDLSHLPLEEAQHTARAAATREAQRHFDIQKGPLYRFELLQLDTTGLLHAFIASLSHLVTDGVGTQAFMEELVAAYRAARTGAPAPLPPDIQYGDFALWQRSPEHQRQVDASLESWKQALAHAPPVLDLPTDFPRRAPALNANMRPTRLTLASGDLSALEALARQEGVSTFTATLALMQAWLHRLSAQSHVVVASPSSGRTLPQTEHRVGYFANILPLCTDVSGQPSFRELLRRAHGVVLHATTHQEVPFKRIADAVQPDASRTAPLLAQALLVLDRFSSPSFEGLSASELLGDSVIPAYDVVLSLVEHPGGGMEGLLATDSALFTPATSSRMAHAFEHLLSQAVRAPDAPLSRLPLLSAAQQAQLLSALAGGPQDVPAGTCIHTFFESQVRRTPNAPAVAHDTTTWSYAELNARANLLARYLLERGLRPEERVAIVMEPSAQGMAALLGILKAGGAYVPLDINWPEPRKRTVLERAGVRRLWADAEALAAHQGLVPDVEVPPRPEHVAEDLEPGPRAVADTQLAYIVFTSGSTGEPKGVMVEHRSVVNHNLAMAARFGLRPGDRMLQFAPLSFDAAAEDLYPPLAVGATVVMRSGLVPAHAMTPYLEETDITIISLPPTYIEEWIRQMEALGQRVPARLRLLAPGGDVLKRETYEAWVRVGGGHAPWLNVYGPTECTITSATCDIPGAEGVGTDATFPIGRPIPRVRFYLLDEHLTPVLPGLPGRVYIGGAALSRGYLRAPDMTAERFIPDPFSAEPGARMYHTGDLARMLPDGRLRFLGRADHQVKIRGFRIELAEIEACLRRFPRVEEAVVLARTASTGLQQLAAYVQAPPDAVAVEALRGHVAEQLPSYMVPAAFVVMEALPINANGKVDRHALPDPEAHAAATKAPEPTANPTTALELRSTLEMRLLNLWREVLNQPGLGPDDDFFQHGGDSILGMRLLARMEEEFGLPVPLATLFQYPVLKETTDALRELLEQGPPLSSVVRLSGPEASAEAPRLFLMHPGDGELHYYRHLVPLLSPHLRCHGLQAPETMSHRGFDTFEARVAAYAEDIRAVQPHGPYLLAGFSFGGYPAYGVAAALEASGEEVRMLALIDTLTVRALNAVAPLTLPPVLQLAKTFEVLDAALEAELAGLSSEGAQWERVAARARERGTVAPHFTGADLKRMWHLAGEILPPQVRTWRVPDVRARLLLFRAEGNPSLDETLGWSQDVPRERIDVVPLPGGHSGAIEPPTVSVLARYLVEKALGQT
ncbi:amino acid adenylation domain-containing protein [Myxococcus sp. NMCA1]|nr:non-ribosomal peptide synthetase [Myxococcus sp. NMCA1]WAM28053.1 amino acid adenylation domain-containing protein [Myxococcus sp. NMCA1]